VVEEGQHPLRGGVAGGLVAGDHQHHHVVAEFQRRQCFSVDRRGDQCRRDVVARVGLAVFGHLVGVAQQLSGGLHPVGRGLRVAVAAAHQPIAPVEDLLALIRRNTDQLTDGRQRQLGGDLGDEVAPVVLGGGRDDLAGLAVE